VFLSKILFATDFSGTSLDARDAVFDLKDAGCHEVVLLHVLDPGQVEEVLAEPSGMTHPSGIYDRTIAARKERNAREKLDEWKIVLEERGFFVRTRLVSGDPATGINRIAHAEQAGLIVIGSHGLRNLRDRLLGTVSAHVISHATRPVLVIRRQEL
jgi:nucleotide-binding universal stress UspA family protein